MESVESKRIVARQPAGRRGQKRSRRKQRACSSCAACRAAKRKCDGNSPCARCQKKGIECVPQDCMLALGAVPVSKSPTVRVTGASELERMWTGTPDPPGTEMPNAVFVGPNPTKAAAMAKLADNQLAPQVLAAVLAISAPSTNAVDMLLRKKSSADYDGSSLFRTSRSLSPSTAGKQQLSHRSLHDLNFLQLHTAGQISGEFGVTPRRPSRFNAGAFVLDTDASVDPATMAIRLRELLISASDAHLARTLHAARRTGGLPLRLLQPVAPRLDTLLRRRLHRSRASAPLTPYVDERGEPTPEVVFDGCHLGIVGVAAALVAWTDDDTLAVAPPPHCIVSAPGTTNDQPPQRAQRSSASAKQDSRAAAAVSDEEDVELQPAAADVAGRACCSLGTLFLRWPHLPRLLDSADDELIAKCRALMQSLHEGNVAFPDTRICDLYADHLLACDTPSMTCVHGEAGGPPLFKSMNGSMADLLGFSAGVAWCGLQHLAQAELSAGMAGLNPVRWLHPECILKRTLAFLAAQNAGLRSFQVEVRYLRSLGAGAAAQGKPAHLAGKRDEYVSVFAIETCHLERQTDGRLLAFSSCLSDVVHCTQPERWSDAELQAAELDVIEALVLRRDQLPLEMMVATRRLQADPVVVMAQCISDRVTAGIFILMANLALRAPPPTHDSDEQAGDDNPAVLALSEGPACSMGTDNPVSASSSVLSAASVTPPPLGCGAAYAASAVEQDVAHSSAEQDALEAARGMLSLQNKASATQAELCRRIPIEQRVQLFEFVQKLVRNCQGTPLKLVTRIGALRLSEAHPLQVNGVCLDMLREMRHPHDPSVSLFDSAGGGCAQLGIGQQSPHVLQFAQANNMMPSVAQHFPG